MSLGGSVFYIIIRVISSSAQVTIYRSLLYQSCRGDMHKDYHSVSANPSFRQSRDLLVVGSAGKEDLHGASTLNDCAEVKAQYCMLNVGKRQLMWDALKQCPYLIQAFFSIFKSPPF